MVCRPSHQEASSPRLPCVEYRQSPGGKCIDPAVTETPCKSSHLNQIQDSRLNPKEVLLSALSSCLGFVTSQTLKTRS
eukprot:3706253-Pyramimonas_sp.AAC.1